MKRRLLSYILTMIMTISILGSSVSAYAAETGTVTEGIVESSGNEVIESEASEDNIEEETVEGTEETVVEVEEINTAEDVKEAVKYEDVQYNASEHALDVLTYEEFLSALEGNGTAVASSKIYTQERKTIKAITNKIYSVNEFNLDYELSADNVNCSSVSGNVALRTLPTPNLQVIVNNPESLKDNDPTTETQIIWIYNDSDVDGDDIVARLVEGFPEGYILGGLNDNSGTEIGFVTRFFNPGTYSIDYHVMDSSQEINGMRYTIDVQPQGDYNIYEGNLSASDEVVSYTIPIDFSSISTAAITYVQIGETDLMVRINDEAGQEVTAMSSFNAIARRWFFIDRPAGVSGIYNYTVTVGAKSGSDYNSGSNGYRLMAGNKDSMEEMISYVDNAVLLGKYTASDSTYDFRTGYTPSKYESYYKFKADGAATVTAMTNHSQTRFKILDAETMITVYDWENDSSAHRTEYTEPFSNIEKQRLAFVAGTEYYLVLYANSPISQNFIADNITLSQGMGRLRSGRDVFTASSSITAGTSGYSSSATISIGNSVPRTAEIKSVDFVSNNGVRLSDIKSFRVKAQYGHTSWRNSVQYRMTIDYPYTEDGSSNTPLRGNWQYGFQASLKSQKMTPIVAMNYNYECGD